MDSELKSMGDLNTDGGMHTGSRKGRVRRVPDLGMQSMPIRPAWFRMGHGYANLA